MAYLGKLWLFMESFIDKITRGAGYFSSVLNILLLVLVFSGVVFRYVLNQPIGWRDEVVAYIFIFANISALCYATYADSHVSTDMLYNRFPPKIQRAVKITGYVLVLFCISFIVYFGVQTVHTFYVRGWRSESEYEFILWPLYGVIPFGFLLFGLQCIVKISKILSHVRREDTPV